MSGRWKYCVNPFCHCHIAQTGVEGRCQGESPVSGTQLWIETREWQVWFLCSLSVSACSFIFTVYIKHITRHLFLYLFSLTTSDSIFHIPKHFLCLTHPINSFTETFLIFFSSLFFNLHSNTFFNRYVGIPLPGIQNCFSKFEDMKKSHRHVFDSWYQLSVPMQEKPPCSSPYPHWGSAICSLRQ